MRIKNKKSFNTKKIVVILAAVLLVATSAYAIYYFFQGDTENYQDATQGDPDVDSPNDGQGGSGQRPSDIDDTSGEDSTDSNEDTAGVSSDSGAITLNNPTENGVLGNGTTIAGRATVQNVTYRIIDNSRGMIAQGELTVSEDKFSAKINSLSPYGDSGVLQVFSIDPDTKHEINLVEVNVRLE